MLNKINEKSNVNVFGSVVSTILSFRRIDFGLQVRLI